MSSSDSGLDLAVRLGKLFEDSGVDQDWKLQKLHADVLSALLEDGEDNDYGGGHVDESILPATSSIATPGRPFSSPVYRSHHHHRQSSPPQQRGDGNALVEEASSSAIIGASSSSAELEGGGGGAGDLSLQQQESGGVRSRTSSRSPQHHLSSSPSSPSSSSALHSLPHAMMAPEAVDTHNLLLRNLLHQQAKKFQQERTSLMRENAVLRSQALEMLGKIAKGDASTGMVMPPLQPSPPTTTTQTSEVDAAEAAVVSSESLVREVEKHREATSEFRRKLNSEARRRSHEVGELSRRLGEVNRARNTEREDLKHQIMTLTKRNDSASAREQQLRWENTRLREEGETLAAQSEKHKVVANALESQLARARTDIDALVESSNKQLAHHQEQLISIKQEAREHTKALDLKCNELTRRNMEMARRLDNSESANQQLLQRQRSSAMMRRGSQVFAGLLQSSGSMVGGVGHEVPTMDKSAADLKNRAGAARAERGLKEQEHDVFDDDLANATVWDPVTQQKVTVLEKDLFQKQVELDDARDKMAMLEHELQDAKNDDTKELMLKETEKQLQFERERMAKAVAEMSKTESELREALTKTMEQKAFKEQEVASNASLMGSPTAGSSKQQDASSTGKSHRKRSQVGFVGEGAADETVATTAENQQQREAEEEDEFSPDAVIKYITTVVHRTTHVQTDPVKFADAKKSSGSPKRGSSAGGGKAGRGSPKPGSRPSSGKKKDPASTTTAAGVDDLLAQAEKAEKAERAAAVADAKAAVAEERVIEAERKLVEVESKIAAAVSKQQQLEAENNAKQAVEDEGTRQKKREDEEEEQERQRHASEIDKSKQREEEATTSLMTFSKSVQTEEQQQEEKKPAAKKTCSLVDELRKRTTSSSSAVQQSTDADKNDVDDKKNTSTQQQEAESTTTQTSPLATTPFPALQQHAEEKKDLADAMSQTTEPYPLLAPPAPRPTSSSSPKQRVVGSAGSNNNNNNNTGGGKGSGRSRSTNSGRASSPPSSRPQSAASLRSSSSSDAAAAADDDELLGASTSSLPRSLQLQQQKSDTVSRGCSPVDPSLLCPVGVPQDHHDDHDDDDDGQNGVVVSPSSQKTRVGKASGQQEADDASAEIMMMAIERIDFGCQVEMQLRDVSTNSSRRRAPLSAPKRQPQYVGVVGNGDDESIINNNNAMINSLHNPSIVAWSPVETKHLSLQLYGETAAAFTATENNNSTSAAGGAFGYATPSEAPTRGAAFGGSTLRKALQKPQYYQVVEKTRAQQPFVVFDDDNYHHHHYDDGGGVVGDGGEEKEQQNRIDGDANADQHRLQQQQKHHLLPEATPAWQGAEEVAASLHRQRRQQQQQQQQQQGEPENNLVAHHHHQGSSRSAATTPDRAVEQQTLQQNLLTVAREVHQQGQQQQAATTAIAAGAAQTSATAHRATTPTTSASFSSRQPSPARSTASSATAMSFTSPTGGVGVGGFEPVTSELAQQHDEGVTAHHWIPHMSTSAHHRKPPSALSRHGRNNNVSSATATQQQQQQQQKAIEATQQSPLLAAQGSNSQQTPVERGGGMAPLTKSLHRNMFWTSMESRGGVSSASAPTAQHHHVRPDLLATTPPPLASHQSQSSPVVVVQQSWEIDNNPAGRRSTPNRTTRMSPSRARQMMSPHQQQQQHRHVTPTNHHTQQQQHMLHVSASASASASPVPDQHQSQQLDHGSNSNKRHSNDQEFEASAISSLLASSAQLAANATYSSFLNTQSEEELAQQRQHLRQQEQPPPASTPQPASVRTLLHQRSNQQQHSATPSGRKRLGVNARPSSSSSSSPSMIVGDQSNSSPHHQSAAMAKPFLMPLPQHDNVDGRATLRTTAIAAATQPLSTKELQALATVEKATRNRRVAQFLTSFDPQLFRPERNCNLHGASLKKVAGDQSSRLSHQSPVRH